MGGAGNLGSGPTPDAIVHVATYYGRSEEDASRIVAANLLFPVSLLEAALRLRVPLFVNTDTYYSKAAALYGHLAQYCLSKRQFRDWTSLFAGKSTAIAHMQLEHVYGPDDAADKFTRSMIRRCLANEPEIALSPGEQRRDFIHVEDVAEAYVAVLEAPQRRPEAFYEVGTGASITIREWVQTVKKTTGSSSILKFGALPYRSDEIMRSEARNESLHQLGWQAKMGLEAGLQSAIAWERST